MISRKHPCASWLLLPPHEQRRALDKVLDFRDQDPDPNASGLPAAAVDWFWQQELPRLMQRPEVRVFAQERVTELQAKVSELRQRIERQVGSMQEEAAAAEAQSQRLTKALEAVS